MEVTKEIIFDTNLFKNETVKLTYKGYLFKANSTDVSIVYGYGDNWENTTEQPMKRTLGGFVTEITLQDFDKLNFCFKNSYEEWDNNNFQDYHVDILPAIIPTTEEVSNISNIQDYDIVSVEQKTNLLDEILGEYTLYFDNKEEFNFQKFVDDIVTEIIDESKIVVPTEDVEISNYVNAELSQDMEVTNIESTPSFEQSADTQEVQEISTENIEEETNTNVVNIEETEEINTTPATLESIEENLIESAVSEENEIYVPVSPTASLITQESNKFVIAARKLTPIYKFKKRVKLFFYKAFGSLPKMLAETFGFNNTNN